MHRPKFQKILKWIEKCKNPFVKKKSINSNPAEKFSVP